MDLYARRVIAVWAAVLVGVTASQGAGFAIYEASARGNAMGGSLVGSTDDASANYYNPANLTDLPGMQTLFGVTLISPDTDATIRGRTWSTDDQWFPPPHGFVSWQVDERCWLGLGLYTPYGLGTKWDLQWPGRRSNQDALIESFTLNPNVAVKLNESLSLALGVQVMYFKLAIKAMPLANIPVGVSGDSLGYGANAALAWDIDDQWSLGLVLRSSVDQSVEGQAVTPGVRRRLDRNVDAAGDVTLPPSVVLGLNYKPTGRLNLGASATYTGWSSYDELAMAFEPRLLHLKSKDVTTKDWEDVFRLGCGAEYRLNDTWAVQAGYIYDMDPGLKETGDYLLPPGDRHIVSAGVSRFSGPWTVSAAYSHLIMVPTSLPRNGLEVMRTSFENGDARMLAFSVGRKF
jgi:long-chain fatty acid transport protein